MSDSLRQAQRIARLNTPLGEDKLALVSFECVEGVSEKFEIKIDALSKEKGLNFDSAIGQNCTVTVKMEEQEDRYFDGILTQALWLGGNDKGEHAYQLVLRPWLWLLSFRRNSLIFRDKTVTEIIEAIFSKHGFAKRDVKVTGTPKLEYCVQYRESDMDFVCRLMEEYGISYYFKHADGEHTLVLVDQNSTFEHIAGGSRQYIPTYAAHRAKKEHFFSFKPERRFTSGKIKLDDYDFKKSTTDLKVTEDINPPFENGTLEVFDSPGRYVEISDGRKIAEAWRDMERANDGHFHAEGDCVSCFAGALLNLEDKSDSGLDDEYLALRCRHKFTEQTYRSGAADAGGPAYEGKFEFIKTDKRYVPPRVTPKAVVEGPQTAKVVGEGDIDVDEYGRILVRFPWDQEEDQSRRCRCAQVWAGNYWGGIYIPRVGMEVVVIFLEGDPDQPLVIGAVYNDKHKPPFDLPAEKSLSGVKSKTTPDASGFNEFVFDDREGGQLVRLHAERNLESVIEKDESRDVRKNRKTKLGENDTLDVGQVLKIDAGTKVEITVGGSKITMTPEKISIKSLMVEINATDFKTDAVMSSHNANGVMDIKGNLVKIN